MHLLVGIGNPGKQYENTRHNAGYYLLNAMGDPRSWKSQPRALTQKINFRGLPLLLIKPTSYVNLSGGPVADLASYYKVPADKVIVAVDDVNLDLGSVRIRNSGSHGGHNGLKSLIQFIGESFPRIRVGVGLCPSGRSLSDYVLGKFSKSDGEVLETIRGIFPDIIETGIERGWEQAAALYNRRGPSIVQ